LKLDRVDIPASQMRATPGGVTIDLNTQAFTDIDTLAQLKAFPALEKAVADYAEFLAVGWALNVEPISGTAYEQLLRENRDEYSYGIVYGDGVVDGILQENIDAAVSAAVQAFRAGADAQAEEAVKDALYSAIFDYPELADQALVKWTYNYTLTSDAMSQYNYAYEYEDEWSYRFDNIVYDNPFHDGMNEQTVSVTINKEKIIKAKDDATGVTPLTTTKASYEKTFADTQELVDWLED